MDKCIRSRPAFAQVLVWLNTFVVGYFVLGGEKIEAKEVIWPERVIDVRFISSGDKSEQPALFLATNEHSPQPLVVFLHQWSGDYRYPAGKTVAKWCLSKNWNFIQPDFRGPNKSPVAMGSDLVVADIASAVEYASQHGKVDPSRIFLLGASGGGHAALLAAARLPGVFRAASVWVPITDLIAWHTQCQDTPHAHYARNIEAGCGGNPLPGSPAEKEAQQRSPLTYLASAKGTTIDINAGIHDGHGSAAVPISHSFRAYNILAEVNDRVPEDVARAMTLEKRVPEGTAFIGADHSYGAKSVLFRRESGNVRLTIFDGGHELVYPAAFYWLEMIAQDKRP